MALRLVRETSDTPNITNKDDTIMTRYAYGGYNGVIKAFGNECGYTAENGIFKVLDGRIVIDGWEIEVDGAGWSLDLSTITGTQYHSVFAEINVAVESVKIDSIYLSGSYPEITKGDDLTEILNGTARLLLYNVKVENGTITEVNRKCEILFYANESINNLSKGLENGTVIPKNSQQVNNLEIKRDENGVLWLGDVIIPQKKLLLSNEVVVSGDETLVYKVSAVGEDYIVGKTLEIHIKTTVHYNDNSPYPYEKAVTVKVLQSTGCVYESIRGTYPAVSIGAGSTKEGGIVLHTKNGSLYAACNTDALSITKIYEIIE